MRRGWIFAALAGCVLCSPVSHDASAQKGPANGQPEPARTLEPSELPAIRTELERIARAQEAEGSRREAEKADDHATRGLKAQENMAWWAMLAFGVSCISLVLGAGGVWALFYTFREQRKLVIREGRAWVTLDVMRQIHWTRKDGKSGWMVYARWKNTGNSPATHVQLAMVASHIVPPGATAPNLELPPAPKDMRDATTLGPDVAVEGPNILVEDSVIRRLEAKGAFVLIRIRATYRDVFQPKAVRESEAWLKMHVDGENHLPDGKVEPRFQYRGYSDRTDTTT